MLVEGNVFDKYRSPNPLYRWLMRRFIDDAARLTMRARPARILEVGSGPGDLAQFLYAALPSEMRSLPYLGTDLSSRQVTLARERYPARSFLPADAKALPFAAGAFDLVIACELLEHVADPQAVLAELARVSSAYVLISVPWEPVWRIMNMCRGKYWSDFGNTPGHVGHFSRRAIRALVAGHFDLVAEAHPLPWTMLLAQKR